MKIESCYLQVVDNHVIKYIPPEEYKPVLHRRKYKAQPITQQKWGCLVVGSESTDPQRVSFS